MLEAIKIEIGRKNQHPGKGPMSAIFWAWLGLSLPRLQGNVNTGHRQNSGRQSGQAGREGQQC